MNNADTEADISIIKINALKRTVAYDESKIISIKGVSENFIYSLGTIQLSIIFDKLVIKHLFHVVPDEFDIPTDGYFANYIYRCNLWDAQPNFQRSNFFLFISLATTGGAATVGLQI